MSDKMREEFQAAFEEEMVARCGEGFRSSVRFFFVEKEPDGSYSNPIAHAGWWAWQASRAAMVVASPEVKAMLDQMEAEEGALYLKAEAFLRETNRASISALQRNFKLAYGSACRLMDAMVLRGVVSPIDSEGRRSVLPVSVPKELLS